MQDQFSGCLTVFETRNRQEVDYVLIGGVAVILHGMERLTRDIDIFVRPTSENIAKLRTALQNVFNDPAINEITLAELQQYEVIRYGTPGHFWIDLMARPSETAAYEDLHYAVMEQEGVKIRVATPETRHRLKYDTLRDKDKADAHFLRKLIHSRSSGLQLH